MANLTLANNKLLGLDQMQIGVAETIATFSDVMAVLPFNGVSGNAYAFNREKTLVDGQLIAADGTITDSSAFDTDLVQIALKGISGQADIANLNLAQGVGLPNDTLAILTASAAKGVSRKFENLLITGTTGANGWDGLTAVMSAFTSQVEDAADAAFTLDLVDAALSRISNGRPQWIMGNAKAENAFRKAMRAAGGITSIELNGRYFMAYDGVMFLRNDWIPVDQDGVTAGNQTDIYFGSFDDGTGMGGLAGIAPVGGAFRVDQFDKLEGKDATRVRVIMYGAAAVFSSTGVSMLKSVTV